MNTTAAGASDGLLEVVPALRGTRAVVFDTDGVITDSARLHATAWQTAFDEFLRGQCPREQPPFDVHDDYLRYVDGSSRLDGARAFLESRKLTPTEAQVRVVAARKEHLFVEQVREGVAAYPGTVRLARARRAEARTFAREALAEDIADIQGGTTGEGIHLGAMAGTLDLVQRCLTGLEPRDGALWLDPVPVPRPGPAAYSFAIRYQGHWGVRLRLRDGQLHIYVPDLDRAPVGV